MAVDYMESNVVMSRRSVVQVLNQWVVVMKKLSIINMKLSGIKSEKIMKKFGITEEELSNLLKTHSCYKRQRDKFLSSFPKIKAILKISLKYKKLERRLLIWIKELNKKGISVDKSTLKQKAMQWYRKMGASYPFKACDLWVSYFLNANKIGDIFKKNVNKLSKDGSLKKGNEELNKKEFLSKLSLTSNQNMSVASEEMEEKIDLKEAEGVRIKMIEYLNSPIFSPADNLTAKVDSKFITDEQQSLFGIIVDKKGERKVLVDKSNEILENDSSELKTDVEEKREECGRKIEDKKLLVSESNEILEVSIRKLNSTSQKAMKEKLEQKLLVWLKKAQENDVIVTHKTFANKALKYNKQFGWLEKFTASPGWIQSFQKRHNVTVNLSSNFSAFRSMKPYYFCSKSKKKNFNSTRTSEEVEKSEQKYCILKEESEQRKELDKHLLNWLSQMQAQSCPVTGKGFIKKALELYELLHLKFKFIPTYTWVRHFERYYNLQLIRGSKYLESLESSLMSNETIEKCDKKVNNKMIIQRAEKKIMNMENEKQDSDKDENNGTELIPLIEKFSEEKEETIETPRVGPSSIKCSDYEDISSDYDLSSTGDCEFNKASSSSSQSGINIGLKEYIALFRKGLIQEGDEEVDGKLSNDWGEDKCEDIESCDESEEEIIVKTEYIEVEVNPIDAENVDECDVESECKEDREKKEVMGVELTEERKVDDEEEVVASEIEEVIADKLEEGTVIKDEKDKNENLVDEEISIKEENFTLNDEEVNNENQLGAEKDDDDLSLVSSVVQPVEEKNEVITEKIKEEINYEDESLDKVGTDGKDSEQNDEEDNQEGDIETEVENEGEIDGKEEVGNDKNIAINNEEDPVTESGHEEETDKDGGQEEEEELSEEVEKEINETQAKSLEIGNDREEIEEQEGPIHSKQKEKSSKRVTFAPNIDIMSTSHSPPDSSLIQPISILKPLHESPYMKEYLKTLKYKLIFKKCKRFLQYQDIRENFKQQLIEEFEEAIDTVITEIISEDHLLDTLLMNKNWAPFGQMLCSEDIARVYKRNIICIGCYEDDKDKYINYSKSSINHRLTSNENLPGRTCDKCKRSTVDIRPAAKCLQCIIPFWRGKFYYRLLYANEIGDLGMTSEQLITTSSVLSKINDLEY